MAAITDLVQICPPPPGPVSVDWGAVESAVGAELPADYKQLATVYGPGKFCEYLWVHHPHGPTEWVDLRGPLPATLRRRLRQDRATGAFPVPHDPDNLFVCGVTDNGEYLFWVTDPADDPDAWRIAVNQARGPGWYTFDGGLVAFLAAAFSGRIEVPLFPDGLLDAGVGFTAGSPSSRRARAAPISSRRRRGLSIPTSFARGPAPTDTNYPAEAGFPPRLPKRGSGRPSGSIEPNHGVTR